MCVNMCMFDVDGKYVGTCVIEIHVVVVVVNGCECDM